jgi:serine/threonine protein kinase
MVNESSSPNKPVNSPGPRSEHGEESSGHPLHPSAITAEVVPVLHPGVDSTQEETLAPSGSNADAVEDRASATSSGPAKVEVPGYEILQELGRGGMGVVYKARQTNLNRLVALKMILAGGHAGSAEIRRFLSEAEAIAAVAHPNIVQIYQVGEDQGLPFIALELVEGGTLADRLKNGPLPAREAARLVEQLARGLNAAHRRGSCTAI